MSNKKDTILFVDDEPNVLKSLKRSLHKIQEWSYMFAESVDTALKIVEQTPPDMIISDMDMPGKSGIDFIITLKENTCSKDIPVVILTGNGQQDLKRKALEAGAIDLLNKPIAIDDLITRIQNVLQLKKYQDLLKNQNSILEERVRERTLQLEFLHRDLIWRFAKVGELRDKETGNHVIRVAHYCKIIALAYGLSQEESEIISLASTLHDIGKVGIRDSILLKPGKLTVEEFEIMKTHSNIGTTILNEQSNSFELSELIQNSSPVATNDELRKTAALIAKSHHEKWDGSGYPDGLKGEAIPLVGRITAIADVYDALRSDRPYKKAFTLEKTISIMTEGIGYHFDPQLAEIFLENLPLFEEIRIRFGTDTTPPQ